MINLARLEEFSNFSRHRKEIQRDCTNCQSALRVTLESVLKIIIDTLNQLPAEPLLDEEMFKKIQSQIEYITPHHLLKTLTVQILALFSKTIDQNLPPKNIVRVEPSGLSVWMEFIPFFSKSRSIFQAYRMIAKAFAKYPIFGFVLFLDGFRFL